MNRRVYATSGERIELWFEHAQTDTSMGGEVEATDTPRFEVRARGSYKQKPGCPEYVERATSPEFVREMCFGECYNPTSERHALDRIEVVKISARRARAHADVQ